MFSYNTSKSVTMGKLSVDSWPIPPIGSVIGYSCVCVHIGNFSWIFNAINWVQHVSAL